jgi:CRISPR/Cas system-associated exonuclease Cas4 (RecB family)
MSFPLNGEPITIVGHLDAYDPETATIYDMKTTRFAKWQAEKAIIPRETHVAQVQSYYTLLDKYAIPVSRLVLVYVGDRDIIPREVSLGNRREWLIQRATVLHSCLRNERIPEPEPDTMCKFCPFVKICPVFKEISA